MSKRSQSTSASLDHLVQSLRSLKRKVETLPPHGDLESLIEDHLAEPDRQWYEMCLEARGQPISSQRKALPASAMS